MSGSLLACALGPSNRPKKKEMSLHFTPTRIRFLENLRSVRVTAENKGVPLGVLISRDVIDHLAAAQKLSRDEINHCYCAT